MHFIGFHMVFSLQKNNSYGGEYTIFTGEDDIKKLGVIDKFNGLS